MRKLVIASVVLLLLTNIVVLTGVAYNRSGTPLISIELTERELPIMDSASSNEENSGTTLSLKWQLRNLDEDSEYFFTRYGTPIWLDDEKLTELGFDMERLKSDTDKYKYRTSDLSREAILVLEYDGELHHAALTQAKERVEQLRQQVADYPDDSDLLKNLSRREKQLSQLKVSETRLYVVDASLDEHGLTQRYAGKKNYLLSRGEIGLGWDDDVVSGHIRQLYLNQVHVPLPLSEQLASFTNGET